MALTQVRHLSAADALRLIRECGSATAVVENRTRLRELVPSASDKLIQAVSQMDDALERAKREAEYAEKHHIRCLTIDEDDYPAALRQCDDAPLVLYVLGSCDLNARRSVSVVGTRHITPYGERLCHDIVGGLAEAWPDLVVVSGLAYGVDVHAHRAALESKIPTVGVVAHGLDTLYPASHRSVAVRIVHEGGAIVTEYMSGTSIDRSFFLHRNRIVAGMTPATLVVESAAHGGSLTTARLALEYGREVFACPGRATDEYSAGCNRLIRHHGATLVTSAGDILETLGWQPVAKPAAAVQQELFPTLSPEEQRILDALRQAETMLANEIVTATGMDYAKVSALLFQMEMEGKVRVHGGVRYSAANA